MCRNIKTLFNFDPPASDEEVRDAAIQFVRKLTGTRSPSKANLAAFDKAVDDIYKASRRMIDDMKPFGPPKNREIEALKLKEKSLLRFRKVGA